MNDRPISYDYASFTLTNGQSDYDVDDNQSALFSKVKNATRMIIKTDKNITCRLNNVNDPAFPINIGDSPFQLPPDFLMVKNIFLSNSSGSNATVQIWLFG